MPMPLRCDCNHRNGLFTRARLAAIHRSRTLDRQAPVTTGSRRHTIPGSINAGSAHFGEAFVPKSFRGNRRRTAVIVSRRLVHKRT
jgi:hypothetical protein